MRQTVRPLLETCENYLRFKKGVRSIRIQRPIILVDNVIADATDFFAIAMLYE
jgi:hypothetical protein